MLHAQIECLQQINFPEFVTVNPSAAVPPSSSLGAACEKHSLQDFVRLGSECQAGIYCPECAKMCPLSMNTVIHCCQNCAEFYCLLCTHEHGYCLTCEIEPPVQIDELSSSSHPFVIDQSSGKANDAIPPVVSQPSPQFKTPLPPVMQTRVRYREKSDSSCERTESTSSDDTTSLPCPHPHNSSFSQSDLTILQQLHRRLRSLEVRVKNFECLFKAKDVMIRNVREEMVQKYQKQKEDLSTLFNIVQTTDARLQDLEIVVPPKTPAFVSMEDFDVIACVESVQDENQPPVYSTSSQDPLYNPVGIHRFLLENVQHKIHTEQMQPR